MNEKKKIFVFLPDGVGFRNFALTKFKDIGESQGFDIYYWNNTIFSLKDDLGFNEVKIENQYQHWLMPVYSRVRKRVELNMWQRQFKDDVYPTYKFPLNYKGLKNIVRSTLTSLLIGLHNSDSGVKRIRGKIKNLERKNPKYDYCKKQLQEHKPNFIFCTSQRSTQAISSLLAAQDLGIPTATFIYSWDNVPKAMKVVETDYYFVWSKHMKQEMHYYYPHIKDEQVIVTGTPQFEPHYYEELVKPRDAFFKGHGLDVNKKYICYSGDDETTSPLDQYYLEDLAKAVRSLNEKGENLAIIYRKCPVDFTPRYDNVLDTYKDVIVSIDPLWRQVGNQWNQVLPTKEDFGMLVNVCKYTEMVTNVCSSTVFDFVVHDKPCIYYNYEQPQLKNGIRDIGQNYNYVHFRSMPSKQAAVFCTDKTQLESLVKEILDGKLSNVSEGKKWYEIIVGEQPTEASENIWGTINKLLG